MCPSEKSHPSGFQSSSTALHPRLHTLSSMSYVPGVSVHVLFAFLRNPLPERRRRTRNLRSTVGYPPRQRRTSSSVAGNKTERTWSVRGGEMREGARSGACALRPQNQWCCQRVVPVRPRRPPRVRRPFQRRCSSKLRFIM